LNDCSISSSSESKEDDLKKVPSILASPSEKVHISIDSFSLIEKSSLSLFVAFKVFFRNGHLFSVLSIL
jgi:hypothetical protein